MRIVKENTIAITVDFQERLVPAIKHSEEIIERAQVLLQGLTILGVKNIVTRQYPKGLGDTVGEIKNVTEDAITLDKVEFSCYDNPSIKKAVDKHNCKNVILCGIEAHVCVLQTAIDLVSAGYNVVLVADCIGSRKNSDKKVALRRAQQMGVRLTTSEAILFELTRAAGTPEFKAISNLIK